MIATEVSQRAIHQLQTATAGGALRDVNILGAGLLGMQLVSSQSGTGMNLAQLREGAAACFEAARICASSVLDAVKRVQADNAALGLAEQGTILLRIVQVRENQGTDLSQLAAPTVGGTR